MTFASTEDRHDTAGRRTRGTSRARLLSAAREEFAHRGLEGARVDEIARRAGVNKQLVYHHFGNKDDLYREVLKNVYSEIRELERGLDLASLPPVDAMRKFIEFSFDYLARNRDFVALLTDENIHKGRHMETMSDLASLHTPLIEALGDVLSRGHSEGRFRAGLEPQQLYISIAALGFFYFNNIYTLSAIFDRSLERRSAIGERRAHVIDFVMHAIEANAGRTTGPERDSASRARASVDTGSIGAIGSTNYLGENNGNEPGKTS